MTELRRQAALADRLLHAQGPGERRLPLRGDAARPVRRAPARARGTASACTSTGGPELWEQKGELRLRALSIERFGLGEHLAALERLKAKLAAEGLFADERKRPLPRLPRRIGLVTGNDAAAKRDVLTAIQTRFPPARVARRRDLVQGPRAAAAMVAALAAVCAEPEVDVVILARGGGSFEDLLPFSDERLVRAVVACPVPVVTAVGHEQDTPLCDLAADRRASTPTAAGRLVVPDLEELLAAARPLARGARPRARRSLERHRERLDRAHERLRRAPALLVERRRAALDPGGRGACARCRRARRSSAATRSSGARASSSARRRGPPGDPIAVEVADGSFGARVE